MCWFKKPQVLPHPEQKPNYAQTANNVDVDELFKDWCALYYVPVVYRNFWREQIDIQVYDAYPIEIMALGVQSNTPAATWEINGKRYLACLAPWANVGVLAHEMAHCSYALLTLGQKAAFDNAFNVSLVGDALVMFLDKQNWYMNTNNVEGHAEVYRYLGTQMPEELKTFYIKLCA